MIAQTIAVPFDTIHLGDVLTMLVILVGYLTYRVDKKKEERIIKAQKDTQVLMHVENERKLNTLLDFQHEQLELNQTMQHDQAVLNQKRDEQISELGKQTALLSQMTEMMDRRLNRIEDQQDRDKS